MYGSVQNRMMEGAGVEKIEVGTGATKVMWSDRYPYTVIEVITQKKIRVQEDDAKLVGGTCQSEHQEYKYTPNPDGEILTLIKTKRGWKVVGHDQRFVVGYREKYYDPCF